MKFFGYKIVRGDDDDSDIQIIQKQPQDGSLELSSGAAGFMSYGIAFDNSPVADESQLITKYRELSQQPEVDKAIDDVINDAFSVDDVKSPVTLDMTDVKIPEATKKKLKDEFEDILNMMDFKNGCYVIFRNWYVDGRIYYHKIIDQKNPSKGITSLRYVDPRKIKKVREQLKTNQKAPEYASIIMNSIDPSKKYVEYYVYNPNGVNPKKPTGVPISPDSIAYIHSGLLDKTNTIVLSHLHKAIKPFNCLRMMEDALVIYRIVRAPERRVFNIEVGNLPKMKAEQYVSEIMKKFNKKLKFDPETGEVSDDKRVMTMLEDFWFPKRDGKGTVVDVLQGGQSLGQIEDVEYFKKKLYESLNVPVSRLQPESQFNMGRSSEITRDELKFAKFVSRLRGRFAGLFLNILGDQLILKGIMNSAEWEDIKNTIKFDFVEDNFFAELKWAEIWTSRINGLRDMEPYMMGGNMPIFSRNFVRDNILHISEEEWDRIQKELLEDQEDLQKLIPPPPGTGEDEDTGASDGQDGQEEDPNAAPYSMPEPDEDLTVPKSGKSGKRTK